MKIRNVIGLPSMLIVISGCMAQPGSWDETSDPAGSTGEDQVHQVQQAVDVGNWALGGNTLTETGRIGSNSNHAIEIEVNNVRALRIEPKSVCSASGGSGQCPNVIAGYSGNTAGVEFGATIAGGGYSLGANSYPNTVVAYLGTVSGGAGNTAGLQSNVGGGYGNRAHNYSTVAGGTNNIVLGVSGAIGGGLANEVQGSAERGVIAGGYENTVTHIAGTIGGGEENTVNGRGGTVPGGTQNWAGGAYSFAAGRRAKSQFDGCFTWADSSDADVTCGAPNGFVARASGGFYLHTNSALNHAAFFTNTSTSWQYTSDRNTKERVAPVRGQEVLSALRKIPVSTWTFKSDDTHTRHMGPMAQDFHAAFGLGESERAIDTGDIIGVSIAAIKGLDEKTEKLERENLELRQRLDRLEAGRPQVTLGSFAGGNLGLAGMLGAMAGVWMLGRKRQTS